MRSIYISLLSLALLSEAEGVISVSPTHAQLLRRESISSQAVNKLSSGQTCPTGEEAHNFIDRNDNFSWCEEACMPPPDCDKEAVPPETCPSDSSSSCVGCHDQDGGDARGCKTGCGCCDWNGQKFASGSCYSATDSQNFLYDQQCGSAAVRAYIYKHQGDLHGQPIADIGDNLHGSGCDSQFKMMGSDVCMNICAGSYPEGLEALGYADGNCTHPHGTPNDFVPIGYIDVYFYFTQQELSAMSSQSIIPGICNYAR